MCLILLVNVRVNVAECAYLVGACVLACPVSFFVVACSWLCSCLSMYELTCVYFRASERACVFSSERAWLHAGEDADLRVLACVFDAPLCLQTSTYTFVILRTYVCGCFA